MRLLIQMLLLLTEMELMISKSRPVYNCMTNVKMSIYDTWGSLIYTESGAIVYMGGMVILTVILLKTVII